MVNSNECFTGLNALVVKTLQIPCFLVFQCHSQTRYGAIQEDSLHRSKPNSCSCSISASSEQTLSMGIDQSDEYGNVCIPFLSFRRLGAAILLGPSDAPS